MKFQEYKDDKNWLQNIEKTIVEIINTTKDTPDICICGGHTIIPVLDMIQKTFQNTKINFYLSDERYVGLDDKHSNYKLISQYLTSKKFTIHHFDTSLPIRKCIKVYNDKIQKINFDLTLLSIGPDGHIASIFPRSKAIHSNNLVEATTTSKFDIKNRLTLTIKKLKSSKNIILLAKNRPETIKKIIYKQRINQSLPGKIIFNLKNTKFFWKNY